MATRKTFKTTKYIYYCENAIDKLVKFCEKDFCYQEIKIFATEKIYYKNEQMFLRLRKQKHNIFDVVIVNENFKFENIDEKVALVVAIGGKNLCRKFQRLCILQNKNYCLVPINFLSEFVFLSKKVPYAVLLDINISNFINTNNISNLFIGILSKYFLLAQIKIDKIFFNKPINNKYICQLEKLILNTENLKNEILKNNKHSKLFLIKNFVELCLLMQKRYLTKKYKFNILMEQKHLLLNCVINEIYLTFFENINNWSISPIKFKKTTNDLTENLKYNYVNFNYAKINFIAKANASYCCEFLKDVQEKISIAFTFLKNYNPTLLFELKNSCENVDFLKLIFLKIDKHNENNFLKIIRNFGFINF